MKCNNCNYQNPDSARFCQQCGAPLFQLQSPQEQFVPQGNPAMEQPQEQFVPQGNPAMGQPQGQFVPQGNPSMGQPQEQSIPQEIVPSTPKRQFALLQKTTIDKLKSKMKKFFKDKKNWRNIFGVLTALSFIFTIYWLLSLTVLKHNPSIPSCTEYYSLRYDGEPRYVEANYMTYKEYIECSDARWKARAKYRDPFGIANYDEMIKCFLGGIFGLIIFGGLFALFFFKTRKKPQPIYPPYNQFYPPYPPANNTGSNYRQMQ